MNDQKDQNEAAGGGSALTAELGADFDRTEEHYLRETLEMLNARHEKMIKPYIDRLVAIHNYRPRPAIMVKLEQAEALGIAPAYPWHPTEDDKGPNAELTGKPIA